MEHVMKLHPGPEQARFGPWARRIVLGVLAFEALGSFIGGPLLIAAPDGRLMNIPVEDMRGFFPDFLVPGLLLTGMGLLTAAGFLVLLRRRASAWLWVGLSLGGFLIWFLVELSVTGFKSWAQAAWGIPVLVGLAAAWPLAMERATRTRP